MVLNDFPADVVVLRCIEIIRSRENRGVTKNELLRYLDRSRVCHGIDKLVREGEIASVTAPITKLESRYFLTDYGTENLNLYADSHKDDMKKIDDCLKQLLDSRY